MHYSLLLPREIVFGWGVRTRVGELAAGLGNRAFLVTGGRSLEASGYLAEIIESLAKAGVEVVHLGRATREPTIDDVDTLTAEMRLHGAWTGDLVIGIGGGAVLDLAKAVAAMVMNAQGRSVREFLEGVGTGATLDVDPLPIIAMPTTAGTGSEATKNAVISVTDPPCKKSLRSTKMMPTVALVDPELTSTCPRDVTAHCAMDALTQLIESYLTRKANRFTKALCLEGIRAFASANMLSIVNPNGEDSRPARELLSHAALLSGITLANSGLGFAHGVAAALGAFCDVPHGLACATLLPAALEVNRESVTREQWLPISASIWGYMATSDNAYHMLADYIGVQQRVLVIEGRLRDLGVPKKLLPQIAAGSLGNSMSGNPREMTVPEILTVLEKYW